MEAFYLPSTDLVNTQILNGNNTVRYDLQTTTTFIWRKESILSASTGVVGRIDWGNQVVEILGESKGFGEVRTRQPGFWSLFSSYVDLNDMYLRY